MVAPKLVFTAIDRFPVEKIASVRLMSVPVPSRLLVVTRRQPEILQDSQRVVARRRKLYFATTRTSPRPGHGAAAGRRLPKGVEAVEAVDVWDPTVPSLRISLSTVRPRASSG